MKKVLLVIVATGLISGCASVNRVPIPVATSAELKGQTVALTQRPLPDFAATTPGRAVFGLVGAALMVSDGNSIIAKNKVADPADAIASSLVMALEETRGAKSIVQRVAVKGSGASDISAAANGAARFVIDVQTINWSFIYFPTDWTHYKVMYLAKARLIDTSTSTAVAEGVCGRSPQASAGAPTYDELLANEASFLKKELALAVEECAKALKADMLKL